jgi:hypothetical protein
MQIILDVPVLSPTSFPLPVDRPFTTARANAAGLSTYNLRKLCEHGLLRRILKGVYVAAQVEDGLLVRAQALALVVPENAAVTDWTALWLWTGLLAPGRHLEISPVQVFRFAGHGRLRNGLCESGERTFRPEDLTVVEGLTVTVPLRTAWDLGRLAHRDLAIGALDALLRLASFGKEQLLEGGDRFKKQRGVRQLRQLAPIADARSESFGESTLRLRWRDCSDLPQPEPQVAVSGPCGVTWWLDLGVTEIRFAAEYDGEAYHSTDEQIEHDRQRREYLDDVERWVIKPVRKENVYGRHRDVEPILYEGVAESRRRLGRFRSR